MAIHFRSMITNQILKATSSVSATATGWCCPANSGGYTKARCPGVFIENATNGNQCPQSGTCSGGKSLPVSGACCYWEKINEKYIQKCKTCNTYEECLNLHQGDPDNLKFSYYPNKSCNIDGGDIVCNGVYNLSYTDCNPDDITNCYSYDDVLGNCCGSSCSITTKALCTESWTPPLEGTVSSCSASPCSKVYLSANRTPPAVSLSSLTSSSSKFDKLPSPGDYYQGGIYIGTFEAGSTNVYGNVKTGSPDQYTSRKDVGYEKTSWVLVADLQDFYVKQYHQEFEDAVSFSASDGLFNTDSSKESMLFYNIKNYKSNGFTDWYLPSMDELALYFNNINSSTTIYRNSGLNMGYYLSSTLFSLKGQANINNNYFVYAQSTAEYGKTLLLSTKNTCNVRLFRRIYVT